MADPAGRGRPDAAAAEAAPLEDAPPSEPCPGHPNGRGWRECPDTLTRVAGSSPPLYVCETSGRRYDAREVRIFAANRLAREAAATPTDPRPHPALVPSGKTRRQPAPGDDAPDHH